MVPSGFITLDKAVIEMTPFPHFIVSDFFTRANEVTLLNWLENTQYWEFTETDFYTQFEFSLLQVPLPAELEFLKNKTVIDTIIAKFKITLNSPKLKLVDLTVHKLVSGFRMGVHNDFLGKEETHRLVIQVNSGWDQNKGGFLMLFKSDNPKDVAKVIQPISNTGIGFEISDSSYHAVSTVHEFSRVELSNRIYGFIDNPIPLWEVELTNMLVQAKIELLRTNNLLDDMKSYNTASAWLGKKIEILEPGESLKCSFQGCVNLEMPSFEKLKDFYLQHGLVPLNNSEIFDFNAVIKLKNALEYLANVSECFQCVSQLAKAIQVLKQSEKDYDTSFSHPEIPFTIFTSVCEDYSPISNIRVAESILHEAMHLKLSLIEKIIPLVKPNDESVFYSPWRGELRPVRGVLHGVFVFSAIKQFYLECSSKTNTWEETDFLHWRIDQINEELGLLSTFKACSALSKEGIKLVTALL